CRTDGIGDLLLATPLINELTKAGGDVSVLCGSYAWQVLENNPDVSEIIIYDPENPYANLELIKSMDFDAAFVVYPRRQVASLVKKAGIPLRFGSANRWYSCFYFNRPVRISRKKNEKHEAEYNLDIAGDIIGERAVLKTFFYPDEEEKNFGKSYAEGFGGDFIMVYPGGKGSSDNLSAGKYAELVDEIAGEYTGKIVLAPGIGEQGLIESVYEKAARKDRIIKTEEVLPLRQFAGLISRAKAFVSGSTGPMHIAAALDVPVVSFFPGGEGMARRWAPVGKVTAVIQPEKGGNMDGIDTKAAALEITRLAETS
ncbi:MAG TPA: lipopolysaccharide heptosyltransferase family protein, partial [Firmicutes bacterium]|nr:lipopolysaccharide heptosyltransferase family protein [Bacillota bacterium]